MCFYFQQPQLEENNNESDKSIITASQAEVDCSSGSNTTVDALNIGIEETATAKLQITSQEDIIRSEMKSDLDSEVTVPEDRKEINAQTTTTLSVLDFSDKHIDNDKTKPDSNCCSLSRQQYECKNSGTKQQNTSNSGDANDNLDVAMLKLESMRLNDKSKRKVNKTSKRQNHLTVDTNFISNNEVKNVTQRPKSPSSVLPRLDSPPSKARKRKSKKKSKSNQNVTSSNEDSSTCKLQNHEVTSGTTSQSTCDSVKFDTYVNKTNNKDSKCTTRKRKSSTEKMYLSPHENDSLR